MIKFKYMKASGEVSERVGIILNKPNANYLVLDLSKVPEDELEDIKELYEAYEVARKDLLGVYSLDTYVKAFKPEGISEVKSV